MDIVNGAGKLVHEGDAQDGERLDKYLARVHPEIGDEAFWLRECEANRVEVRDKFSLRTGTYSREKWYLTWYSGGSYTTLDLADGERPRMRHGTCHIVKEDRSERTR